MTKAVCDTMIVWSWGRDADKARPRPRMPEGMAGSDRTGKKLLRLVHARLPPWDGSLCHPVFQHNNYVCRLFSHKPEPRQALTSSLIGHRCAVVEGHVAARRADMFRAAIAPATEGLGSLRAAVVASLRAEVICSPILPAQHLRVAHPAVSLSPHQPVSHQSVRLFTSLAAVLICCIATSLLGMAVRSNTRRRERSKGIRASGRGSCRTERETQPHAHAWARTGGAHRDDAAGPVQCPLGRGRLQVSSV